MQRLVSLLNFMKQCKICYSYAVNHHCHGRDGSDPDLCDVCYWRKRADKMAAMLLRIGWPAQGSKDDIATIGDFSGEIQAAWKYEDLEANV
jgi:hypothetical protein